MDKEKCVRCGKETKYDTGTPITLRRYFIEGAGKLCEECWAKLWPVTTIEIKKMKLYHGSKDPNITEFKLKNNRSNLDFGVGVYLTTIQKQAEQWAGKNGVVYVFEIDLSALHVMEYTDEDLHYVLYLCRIDLEDVAREAIDGFEDADIIAGKMLDGSVHGFEKTAEEFNEGEVSYEELKRWIRLFDKKDQLCFKTQKAIDLLNKSLVGKYGV